MHIKYIRYTFASVIKQQENMKVQVSMVIQSHLSDAMVNPNQEVRNIQIAFAKYLIHYFGLGEKIDPNKEFELFCKDFKINLEN